MGARFEIQAWWCRSKGGYDWYTVWTGNSRIGLLFALIPALGGRQDRPLRVIYR